MRSSPPLLVVAIAVTGILGLVACSDRGSDRRDTAPTPLPRSGDCGDIVTALTAWGDAGFSGAMVMQRGHGPACGAGVGPLRPGSPDPITVDSAFAVGSVTKTFVAAAILQLESDDVLRRADRVGDHVPGLGGPVAHATIDELLLHTSGLTGTHGRDHRPLSRADAVASISSLSVDASRRGTFLYSDAGFTLLALVIDEAGGGYRSYLAERTLPEGAGFWDGQPAPAGARVVGSIRGEPAAQRGGFGGPHWALAGNGDVSMSTAQLAGWVRRLVDGGVIPAPAVEVMTEAVVATGPDQGVTRGWGRLGAAAFGAPALVSAGGGGETGHNVVVAWIPTADLVVVVSSSSDAVTAEDLLLTVAPALLAGDPLPRPDAPGEADPERLRAAAGTYRLPGGSSFTVEVRDGGLDVRPSGAQALRALLPLGDRAADEIAAHEDAVRALLAGETQAGREELGVLEEEGRLDGFSIIASIVAGGELRTYVELDRGGRTVVGWYALDDAGGIGAADLGGYPLVRLVPTADGFQPPAAPVGGDGPSVRFDRNAMTVRWAGDTIVAVRS